MHTPEGLSAVEALGFLEFERHKDANVLARKQRLAQRMQAILKAKGALVFGKDGLYGGTNGLIGSANPGRRFVQGTVMVRVDQDAFVALRHPAQEDSQDSVQLITSRLSGNEYLSHRANKLVAAAGQTSLTICGVDTIEPYHLDAVEVLVNHIDTNLEPVLDGNGPNLPRVSLNHLGTPADRVIDLRALDTVPYDLYR